MTPGDAPPVGRHGVNALLCDLYALNMIQAYLAAGMERTAVFEFFVRRLPPGRGFLVAAGLEQVLDFLEGLRVEPEEMEWLRASGQFDERFLSHMEGLRFTGDVHAMPEGTVAFADEPLLRITAPLPQAQLIEARLMNILHFQTMIASKAARMVLAAAGRPLVDFGLRRSHGSEAGVMAARAAYLAGFAATATVSAGLRFGIPTSGTMAHSFIQAHDDETEAFRNFARARPENAVLLLDTYDTEAAAHKVAALAPALAAEGIRIAGVRLDSGDLGALARRVRRVLDAAGLTQVKILASGGIDEARLTALARAPIDGFGIGGALVTSQDAPVLDTAYKLQEYDGLARRKRSAGKATWPGRKQVWRRLDRQGRMAGDVLSVEDDSQDGAPLIAPVMRQGRRLDGLLTLAQARERAAAQLAALPPHLARLSTHPPYEVTVAPALRALAEEVDRRTGG